MASPDAKTTAAATTSVSAINVAPIIARLSALSENIASVPAAAPSKTASNTLNVLNEPGLAAAAKKDAALASQIKSANSQATSALKDSQAKRAAYQSTLDGMIQSAMNLLKS
jgi:hypothetical protein